jgi:hypothetical protein
MVMIVKDPEKKACGFISVTWITVRAHVSALPGPPTVWRRYTPVVPRRYGWPAHAVALDPLATAEGRRSAAVTAGANAAQ